ncbi:hypothetical protein M9458_024608, partial [Cirrhinus mrigala]
NIDMWTISCLRITPSRTVSSTSGGRRVTSGWGTCMDAILSTKTSLSAFEQRSPPFMNLL